jgi:hypothetical protein
MLASKNLSFVPTPTTVLSPAVAREKKLTRLTTKTNSVTEKPVPDFLDVTSKKLETVRSFLRSVWLLVLLLVPSLVSSWLPLLPLLCSVVLLLTLLLLEPDLALLPPWQTTPFTNPKEKVVTLLFTKSKNRKMQATAFLFFVWGKSVV